MAAGLQHCTRARKGLGESVLLATYTSFGKFALASALATANFAGVASTAPAEESEDSRAAAERAKALFEKAASEYETSSYNAAVKTFTEAYLESQGIEDEAFRIKVQSAIFYNLARAHIKAYGVDREESHLHQAIELLNKSLSQTKDPKDQEQAHQTIAQAQEILDGLAQSQAGADGGEPEPEPEPEPGPVVDEPTVNKPMRIAGFALLGAGVVGGGLAGFGAAQAANAQKDYDAGPTAAIRDAAESKGDTANLLIISGSAAAGVFLAAGVTLVILSKKKGSSKTAAGLMLDANTAGLTWGGRF